MDHFWLVEIKLPAVCLYVVSIAPLVLTSDMGTAKRFSTQAEAQALIASDSHLSVKFHAVEHGILS